MKIQKDAVVSVRVEIVDETGNGAPAQDLDYLHGGYGNLFPKVEAALAGLEPGASTRVKLAPAEGFGEHDPRLIMRERRERLPSEVEVGSVLRVREGNDGGTPPTFRVVELSDTEATLDGNHPLAGRTVELHLAVLDVRPATNDEIEHGHAHGADGAHSH